MKRTASILLLGVMVLSLAACGKTAKESPAPSTAAPVETTAPVTGTDALVDESAPVEETAAPEETEEHVISGVINRMGDYLVLLTEDDSYQIFDLGKGVSTAGLEPGDQVTVTYTGSLGDEKTPPVISEITKS